MAMDTRPLTNEIIKEVATDAMVARGTVGDLDETKTTGIYLMDGSATSASTFPYPYKLGILEVLPRGGGVLQRYTPSDMKCVCQRFYSVVAKTWSAWYQMTFTIVS